MKKLLVIPSALLIAPAVFASVSITFNTDSLRTSAGAFTPTGGLALLIADADGLGFGDIAPGGIAQYDSVGSGDVVVARYTFAADGIINGNASGVDLTGFDAGDQLAIYWFPTLTSGDSSVTAGTSYGRLTDATWVTPSDGGDVGPYQVISFTNQGVFSSNATTLNVTDAQSQADLNVVPEPGTYAAMAGLAVLGFVAMRRRKQRR